MENRRAQVAVVVAIVAAALLTVAAGLSLIAEEPAAPARTPVATNSRHPSATPTAAVPATTPNATPTPGGPTIEAGDGTPAGMHPLDTRTGIPAVDAVLDALEHRNGAALAAMVRTTRLVCSNADGLDIACPVDEPEAAAIDGFFTASCHGGYTLRDGFCQDAFAPSIYMQDAAYDPALHADTVRRLVAICDSLDATFAAASPPKRDDLIELAYVLKAELGPEEGYPL